MEQQIYMQIADDITSQIRKGEYKLGEKLPSQRDLCKKYSVSPSSVEKAISVLVSNKIIETRERSGNYVLGPSIDEYDIQYDYVGSIVTPEITSYETSEPRTVKYVVEGYNENKELNMVFAEEKSICSKTVMICKKAYIPFGGKGLNRKISFDEFNSYLSNIKRDDKVVKMRISTTKLTESEAKDIGGREGTLYFVTERWDLDKYKRIMCYTKVYAHNSCFVLYGKS